MRGNASGAISALTLLGSKIFNESLPPFDIFLSLIIFIFGMATIAASHVVMYFICRIERSANVQFIIDPFEAFEANPILGKIRILLDVLSIFLLISGMFVGLRILYRLCSHELL